MSNSYCMFCGADPCECNAQPAKPAKKKAKKTAVAPARLIKTSNAPTITGPIPQRAELVHELSEDELDYRSCVRALETILAPESKQEVAHILNAEPSFAERQYDWVKAYRVERERANESQPAD